MPRQAYMVCSLSGAADAFTGSISCFNIIETIKVTFTETPIQAGRPFAMRAVSTWMRDSEEQANQEFEGKLILYFGTNEPFVAAQFPNFKFAALFHKLVIPEIPLPGFPQLGLMSVECQIRRVGENDWIKGPAYPILIEENQSTPPAVQAP